MINIDINNYETLKKAKEKYGAKMTTEKVNDYLNITLTLITIAIFIGFAIRPSISTILQLRNEINEYTVIEKALSDKIINLSIATSLQNEYSTEIGLLDKAIPEKSDESTILKILNHLSIQNNLALTKVSNTFTKDAKYQTVNMNLELLGTYASVLDFLKSVNQVLRIISIDEITMDIIDDPTVKAATAQTNLSKIPLLKISIKAKAYYESDKIELKQTEINNQVNNDQSDQEF